MMTLVVRDVVNHLPVYGAGKLFIHTLGKSAYLSSTSDLILVSAIADLHMELTMLVLM